MRDRFLFPKPILGFAGLLALFVLPGSVAAQPVDLLDPGAVAEAAGPKPPLGFPVLPGIYRLDGTDPGLPQADLEPLRQILGNAPIVALGEAIHTSGGYYEMKHRVFRFLVEKMGFRAFAIESSWMDAERASQYVRTCAGTPEEAIRGLFTVWQSTEVRDLVQWMCDWNRSHRKAKDKIHFFGFDVQQPERDRPALLAFLERIGVGPEDPRSVDVAACRGISKLIPDPIPEPAYRQCLAGLQAVEQLFRANERSLIRRTSRTDLAQAWMSLVGLRSWQGYAYYLGLGDYPRGDESRDSGMAYVFQAIRKL
ncbi:MAG TPA: erythromycin esterase family protein, partial [Thermoanaerobaculia bacterium]|nr:erythromycin esterase family protein [Thermoanaerobaculia bacterium]